MSSDLKGHWLQVRVLLRSPNRPHPELHSVLVEQFLAMLRFEQRDKLPELPVDLDRSGQDDFPNFFQQSNTGILITQYIVD